MDREELGQLFQTMKQKWFELKRYGYVPSWKDLNDQEQEELVDELMSLAYSDVDIRQLRTGHNSAYQIMEETGWVYGEVLNEERKVSPNMLPFRQMLQSYRDECVMYAAFAEFIREIQHERN